MTRHGQDTDEQLPEQYDIPFKVLAEMSPAGIHVTDSIGKCLYVNPAWCRMAGLTLEEALGDGWIKAIYREDLPRLLSEWKKFMKSTASWESEYRFVDHSGRITWVYGTATILTGKDILAETILGITINITERKKYEAELKESEERLRLASEATGLGTFSYDFVTGKAYYSKELLHLYGLSSDETLKLDEDLIVLEMHPADRQLFLREMQRANNPCGSGILDIEFRIIRKDGKERWLRTRGLTTFTGNSSSDRPLRAAGIVQDITDTKKNDQKLYESEKKYRNLVELSPNGIAVYQNGSFAYVNEAGLKMMGCRDQEELIGKPVLSIVHPDSRREVTKRMKLVANGITVSSFEEKLIRIDGSIFEAEVISIPVTYNDKPAAQVIVTDITERKKAEKELEEKEEKYRAIFESTGTITLIVEENTEIAMANRECYELSGYTPEELVRQKWTRFVSTESIGEMIKNHKLRRLNPDLAPKKYQANLIHRNGGIRNVVLDIAMIPGSKQSVVSMQDITEFKKIETALKHASDYNRSLIEASLDPLVTIGPDGKILDVNKATQKITGYRRQKLIGTEFSAYFTDPAKAQSGYEEVFSKGFVRDYSLEIKNINGDVIPVLYNATLYSDDAGKIIGVFAAARDISELKKVEDALKKKEANLRSLIENSDWSIWSVTRDFNLIDANSSFIEKFKTGTGRLLKVGDNVIDDLPSKIKKDWIRYYKRCLSGESFNIVTNTQPPPDLSYVRYSFNPIKTNEGDVLGLTIIGQDISDLKKTEEKLKKSANELRELSNHIGDLMEIERTQIARDLHDDLGQKLTALNMDMAFLKSRIGVQARSVENKMKSMTQILNDSIESVRKISYGLRPSILDDLGLHPAIDWQLSEFKKSSGINYNFSFIPEEMILDSRISLVVFRIIQESLTNVTRHSHATHVTVKIKLDEGKLKLFVKDNGIGIDSEKLKKRLSLGLLGMKERARSFGGELSIRGTEGKGTVVTLDIPTSIDQ